MANLTGCGYSTAEELVQCMRGKSKDELVDATKKVNGLERIYTSLHKAGITDAFSFNSLVLIRFFILAFPGSFCLLYFDSK